MKDLTVIVPLHKFDDDVRKECDNSFARLNDTINNYKHGNVSVVIVAPPEVCEGDLFKKFSDECPVKFDVIRNDGKTDYCSQVNLAVDSVQTEHFSIMEFDDEYTPKWFNMAHDYFVGNEEKSVMLPVNLFHDEDDKNWQYGNTMALSPTFITENIQDTDPLGVINKFRIEGMSAFNLTGAIFNTQDFITAGKYKPSMEVAFNYEFLLRLTNKGMKAVVAPKEGYVHEIGRRGSLGDAFMQKYNEEEVAKWHSLAMRESKHDEDRGLGIDSVSTEVLK